MKQINTNVSSIKAAESRTKPLWAKKQIAQAAVELLKEKDPEAISISELCEKAGVGRASFYRHYQNLDDVLMKETLPVFESWKEKALAGEYPTMSALIESLLKIMLDKKDLFKVLTKRNRLSVLKNVLMELFGPDPDNDPVTAYSKAYVAYMFYGFVETWLQRGMKEDPEELAAHFPGGSNAAEI